MKKQLILLLALALLLTIFIASHALAYPYYQDHSNYYKYQDNYQNSKDYTEIVPYSYWGRNMVMSASKERIVIPRNSPYQASDRFFVKYSSFSSHYSYYSQYDDCNNYYESYCPTSNYHPSAYYYYSR